MNNFDNIWTWKSWEHLFKHSFHKTNWNELFAYEDHDFKVGVTPFSQFPILPAVITIYLILIFSIQAFMKNRKPLELKYVSVIHNFILCLWSLIMCVGVVYEVAKRVMSEGPLFTVCEADHGFNQGPAYYWSYIFYISKFYELFDTIIIVLRKKPLIFLHVYHHCVVVWLCWYFMYTGWPLQLWVVFLNTFVHVFMYYFYLQTGLGRTVWWKKYITMIQIIQFVCLGIVGILHFAAINTVGCVTNTSAFVAAYAINFSFLFLFTRFYSNSYNRSAAVKGTTQPSINRKKQE
ncbi:GNS1/SUR4 family protein [Cavenderia fasciculata]|uniref:Elongation of fatty acids protein n=1 Tax=Cavenderia fasciculata TaxID=261658 RepID=F4PKN2_CACFS|nr:GNS1/SUR4 family protein [Cavenderia fasciculata]EGG24156.1 GNS1/SUR4 family protein [Cavenderia fasciculata]|eukprot:XP_004362007.1 GNS1/SUR4 family protein [Cavenderia fasciculata]